MPPSRRPGAAAYFAATHLPLMHEAEGTSSSPPHYLWRRLPEPPAAASPSGLRRKRHRSWLTLFGIPFSWLSFSRWAVARRSPGAPRPRTRGFSWRRGPSTPCRDHRAFGRSSGCLPKRPPTAGSSSSAPPSPGSSGTGFRKSSGSSSTATYPISPISRRSANPEPRSPPEGRRSSGLRWRTSRRSRSRRGSGRHEEHSVPRSVAPSRGCSCAPSSSTMPTRRKSSPRCQRVPGVSAAVLGDFRPLKGEARIEFVLASRERLAGHRKAPGRTLDRGGRRADRGQRGHGRHHPIGHGGNGAHLEQGPAR